MGVSRIHLTIDRLRLSGLDPAAQRAFVTSLEGELRSVIAEPARRAAWASSHRTPVLRMSRVPLEPGSAGARKLGAQVARGIGRGLKP